MGGKVRIEQGWPGLQRSEAPDGDETGITYTSSCSVEDSETRAGASRWSSPGHPIPAFSDDSISSAESDRRPTTRRQSSAKSDQQRTNLVVAASPLARGSAPSLRIPLNSLESRICRAGRGHYFMLRHSR